MRLTITYPASIAFDVFNVIIRNSLRIACIASRSACILCLTLPKRSNLSTHLQLQRAAYSHQGHDVAPALR
jgi:hypothetical protein